MAFELIVEDNKVIRTDTKTVVTGGCFNYKGWMKFIKRNEKYYLSVEITPKGLLGKVTNQCKDNQDIDSSSWKLNEAIDFDGIVEIQQYEGKYYLCREIVGYTEPTPKKKSWWWKF